MVEWLREHPEDAATLHAVSGAAAQLGDALRAPVDTEAALAAVLARRTDVAAPAPDIVSLDAARALRRSRTRDTEDDTAIARPSRRGLAIGAAAILFMAVGLFTWRTMGTASRNALSYAAASGGFVDSLTLRDGTLVVLGAGSSISHGADFGDGSREVVLEGDGYFDVARDDARAFTVRAEQAVIVDLGTAFAVRSGDARGITVAVTSGRVQLSDSATPDNAIELTAGDAAFLPDTSRIPVRDTVTVSDAVAWTRGTLAFRDAPVDEVAAVLQRWYGVVLDTDSTLRTRRVTATFDRESRATVLDVIALSLGARLEMRGDTARVRTADTAR